VSSDVGARITPSSSSSEGAQRAGARTALVASGPRWLPLAAGGAVIVALLALVLAAATSGAFGPRLIADPGAVVRWAAPMVTVLSHLATAVTVGGLLMVVTLLPRTLPPRRGRARSGSEPSPRLDDHVSPLLRASLLIAAVAAGTWAILAAARLLLDYADIVGESPASPTFGAQVGVFVTEISLGRMLASVALIAALVATLALAISGPTGAAWTLAVAGVALVLLAQTGHAAGTADHALAVGSMLLHLAGAAVWLGGLAAIGLLARRLGRDLEPVVARYSVLALWAYAAVAISGIVNAWIRVGGVDGLTTPYGRLVLVKAALMLALGAAGYAHRRVTIPRLPAQPLLFWRLATVELAVMGAVSGVAVALAGTPPPVPQEPPAAPTPTEVITGYPAPPEPTAQAWFGAWRPDVLFAVVSVLMVVVYVRWVLRLRRRGDRWSPGRTAAWLSGAVVFGYVTNGAPAVYGTVLFSWHMLEHMTLATLTPVLFALGAPVTLALRALPVRHDRSRGPREWLLALVESGWARFFAHPIVAAVNFAGSMIVFYYTGLFQAALTSHVGHVLMVVHFSLVGYLFANVLVGIDPGPRRPAYPIRLVLLFVTMAFHAFFGVALAQSTALLAADWFGALGLPWGVDALADQRRGANLAWGIGEIPTLVLAAVAAVQWSREEDRTARRTDRQADRDGDAELAAYNAMLARLAERDDAGPPR
jgi:cytochrome c oxidase assembly factor CtaG